MFKSLEHVDFLNGLDLDVEGLSVPLNFAASAPSPTLFTPVDFPTPIFEMTANAPVTPVLWQEGVDLAGPRGVLLALTNGNILVWREAVDAGTGNVALEGYITDSFGNIVVSDMVFSAFSGSNSSNFGFDVVALSGGGFAALEADSVNDTLTVLTYTVTGVEISAQALDLSGLGQLVADDVIVTANSAGVIFATARIFDGADASQYGWTIDSSGVASAPFIVADDGFVGLSNNDEDPFNLESIAVNNGRFVSLIRESDAFGLSQRRTIDLEVTNPDGSSHLSIELTAPSDGSVLGNSTYNDIAFLGGLSVGVVYRESPSSGGDGLIHLAFANVDTGVLGSNIVLPTGGVSAENISMLQITALENSAGSLSGEFLISFLNDLSGGNQIHMQRYSAAGVAIGSEVLISVGDGSGYSIENLDVSRLALIYTDTSGDQQYEIYTYASEGNVDDAGNYIGSAGDETLNNTNQGTTGEFYLSAGNDTVIQTTSVNLIDLGIGNDSLTLNTIPNNLSGTVDGGEGTDSFTASFAASNISLTLDMNGDGILYADDAGIGVVGQALFISIENITTDGGDDDIRGDDANNTFSANGGDDILYGYGGNDILSGANGDDILVGGDGADLILGGFGNDILAGGAQNDNLQGFDGDDTFYQWDYGGTASGFTDTIDGGNGTDTLRLQIYNDGPGNVDSGDYTFNFGTGVITGSGETINITSIEILYAGDGDSTFIGTNAVNTVYGQGGDDIIFGFGGDDILDGGEGDDTISGGTGADTIDGGDGIDTGDYTFTNGDLTVNLDSGQAFATSAGFGGETITNVENLILGGGDDNITGDAENNHIDGGNGDDIIFGLGGDDILIGGGGDDVLDGGSGSDTADYSYTSANLTIDLANGEAYPTSLGNSVGDSLFSIENANGGGGDDLILDRSDDTNVFGDAGNDRFVYVGGNDSFDGWGGVDTLDLSNYLNGTLGASIFIDGQDGAGNLHAVTAQGGGAVFIDGSDVETFIGSTLGANQFQLLNDAVANVIGGDENDFASLLANGSSFDGRGGSDRLSYGLADTAGGVTIDAVQGIAFANVTGQSNATDDSFTNVERVQGSTEDDIIIVSAALIEASGGASGDDTIIFQSANDVVAGQFISGGLSGTDRLAIDLADGDEIDFRNISLVSFQQFEFATSVQGGEAGVIFEADQFGETGRLAIDLHVIGTDSQNPGASNILNIFMSNSTTLDLSAFTFTDWNNANNEINLTGDADDEMIRGSSQNDNISGNGGNDILFGGSGNDIISGGAGDDIISGGSGSADTLIGGDGNDTADYTYTNTSLTVDLTLGTAFITANGSGPETLHSIENLILGDGNDALIGNTGANIFSAGGGNDTLYGGIGNDTLSGNVGDDELNGGQGADTLNGNVGNDVVNGDSGSDFIIGAGGDDTLNGGDDQDEIFGGTGDDTLDGGNGNDRLFGDAGMDTLTGGIGIDFLRGGDDDDMISGGDGVDRLFGDNGNDILDGGADRDILLGGDGNDTLYGDSGNDTVFGEAGDDILNGGDGVDLIRGDDGDDVLNGDAGIDRLFGDNGSDMLNGGIGNDILRGGDGIDLLIGGGDNDRLFGDAGNDTLGGETGNDDLLGGMGDDLLSGGAGDDRLFGDAGVDSLNGGDDNDLLRGGDDNDVLNGGSGDDRLFGDTGDDVLEGGEGADVLRGGAGADSFAYTLGSGVDAISDFGFGADTIFVDAAFGLSGFNDLQILQRGANTLIRLEPGGADTLILFDTVASSLTAADFVFENAGNSSAALDDFARLESNLSDSNAVVNEQALGLDLEFFDFNATVSQYEVFFHEYDVFV